MRLTTTTFLLPLLSAPAALSVPVVSMAIAATEWTLQKVTRTVNSDDSSSLWQFAISTGAAGAAATPCNYVVNKTAAAPSTRANGGPTTCGAFEITSGWSGQFGEGEGFTVISVVDRAQKLIAYPAYRDVELKNATAVEPDRSYPVQSL